MTKCADTDSVLQSWRIERPGCFEKLFARPNLPCGVGDDPVLREELPQSRDIGATMRIVQRAVRVEDRLPFASQRFRQPHFGLVSCAGGHFGMYRQDRRPSCDPRSLPRDDLPSPVPFDPDVHEARGEISVFAADGIIDLSFDQGNGGVRRKDFDPDFVSNPLVSNAGRRLPLSCGQVEIAADIGKRHAVRIELAEFLQIAGKYGVPPLFFESLYLCFDEMGPSRSGYGRCVPRHNRNRKGNRRCAEQCESACPVHSSDTGPKPWSR